MNVIRWDGNPIDKPGLYSGIPMADYHNQLCVGPSISSSGLRTIFSKSPAHYFVESYLNPEREEEDDDQSQALIFGRGAHHLLLGEEDFAKHFVIRPATLDGAAWQGNRTACKEWLKMMKRDQMTVLKGEEITAIRGMAAGLHAHPMCRAGILNGLIEHSMVWKDRETGIWLKVRPDAIPTDDMDISDLKSCADISDEGIERAIGDNGYYVQGALVGEACRHVLKREMSSFSLVFSEKKPPNCARVKTLIDDDLKLGEKVIRASLRLFARCLDRGVWPGPGGEQSDAEYAQVNPFKRGRIEGNILKIEQELDR